MSNIYTSVPSQVKDILPSIQQQYKYHKHGVSSIHWSEMQSLGKAVKCLFWILVKNMFLLMWQFIFLTRVKVLYQTLYLGPWELLEVSSWWSLSLIGLSSSWFLHTTSNTTPSHPLPHHSTTVRVGYLKLVDRNIVMLLLMMANNRSAT